jgi:hypothetical protein
MERSSFGGCHRAIQSEMEISLGAPISIARLDRSIYVYRKPRCFAVMAGTGGGIGFRVRLCFGQPVAPMRSA